MAKLDPRILRMRETTCIAVQKLLDACIAKSERHALLIIFERTTKSVNSKNYCATGFVARNFHQFYQQYKDFKRSVHFHQFPLSHENQ
jgi:hypothetical protein